MTKTASLGLNVSIFTRRVVLTNVTEQAVTVRDARSIEHLIEPLQRSPEMEVSKGDISRLWASFYVQDRGPGDVVDTEISR